MLYEKYQRKMLRISSIFKFIWRFRIPIAIFALFIFAVMTTFTLSKGTVYDEENCPTQIVYGEKLNYKAKAFMTDVTYEYCEKGSNEWTDKMPIRAGEYKVRAVANKVFGGKGYGEEQSFKILPKPIEISVAEEELPYGESPTAKGEVVLGDVISCEEFTFEEKEELKFQIQPILDVIKILDQNGNDVTSSYSVSVLPKEVATVQREITVTVKDVEKVYDGVALSSNEISVTEGSVLENQAIETEAVNEIIDVGTQENIPTVRVMDENGDEVTRFYKINVIAGQLKVTKRPITVLTGSKTLIYTGQDEAHPNVSVTEGNLVEGHDFSIINSTKIKNVGEIDNQVEFDIVFDGEIKTHNYEITVNCGKLTIQKRDLNLLSNSTSWTYDSLSHSNQEFVLQVENQLIGGHFVEVVDCASITNVGKTDNIHTYEVFDGEKENVTLNYNIIAKSGVIEITPRPITLLTATNEWVYDGQEKFDTTFTCTSELGIVAGQEAKAVEYAKIVNKGEIDNLVSYSIVMGEEDLTSNYTITVQSGKLKITARLITVKPIYAEKIYDATPLYSKGVELSPNSALTLVSGHSVFGETLGSRINAGVGIGESSVKEGSVTVKCGEEDMTLNYEFDYENGDLVVLRREIYIKPVDESKIYDGELPVHTKGVTQYDVDKENVNLVDGHQITASKTHVLNSYEDVGEYLVEIEEGSVIISDGEHAVTENYQIQYATAYAFKINKRPVVFVPIESGKVYDGLNNDTVEVRVKETDGTYALVNGHRFVAETCREFINAGEYDNYVIENSVIIFNDQRQLNHNYEIITDTAKYIIEKRKVSIKSTEVEKVYDSIPYSFENTTWEYSAETEYNLVGGHYLTFDTTADEIYEVFSGEYFLINVKVWGELSEDVTSNYQIDAEKGAIFTISQRSVRIKPKDESKMYDGTPLISTIGEIAEGSVYDFVEGHYSLVDSPSSQTDKGISASVLSADKVTIFDKEQNDVTKNYAITTAEGVLEVTARTVTVKAGNGEKIYDGTPLQSSLYFVVSQIQLVEGHTLFAQTQGSIVNVGQTDNVIIPESVRVQEGELDRTANYEFSYEKGLLEVFKRPITVTTNTNSWVYDGQYHFDNGFTVTAETVADNQEIVASVWENIKNVNEEQFDNVISCSIYHEEVNVTVNYEITYVYGTLTITKRPITVATHGATITYDGEEHHFDEFGITSPLKVVEGEEIIAYDYYSVKDAGVYDNKFGVGIFSGEENVTYNYEITYDYGKIIVYMRNVYIKIKDVEKIYNGLDWQQEELCLENVVEGKYLELVSWHTVEFGISSTPEEGVIRGFVGLYQLDFNGIQIKDGEEDVTKNYEIYSLGTDNAVIKQRPIKLETDTCEKVYDATPLFSTLVWVTEDSPYELAEGDMMQVVSYPSIIDVGTIDNYLVVSITRKIDGVDVDAPVNYAISWQIGRLTVTQREITVKPNDIEKEYDGERLSASNEIGVSHSPLDALINGHTISAYEIIGEGRIDVGESQSSIVADSVVITSGEEDVTKNYKVILETGKITVTPRLITVETKSKEFIYDGKAHGHEEYSITVGSLVEGHEFKTVSISTVTYVEEGEVENKIQLTVFSGEVDVTGNYELTFVCGKIKVVPVELYVKTFGKQWTYDGQEHFNDVTEINYTVGELSSLDEIVKKPIKVVEVGQYVNACEITIVDIETREDRTDNYVITYIEYGILEILQRTLIIQTVESQKVYNGKPWSFEEVGYEIVLLDGGNPLVEGQEIVDGTVEITPVEEEQTDGFVGSYFGAVKSFIICEGEYDVTHNYRFEQKDGVVHQIIKRKMTVTTGTVEKVYDGTPIQGMDTYLYEIEEGEDIGLAEGEDVSNLRLGYKDENVGSVNNEMALYVFRNIDSSSFIITTDNYDVTYIYGLLTILPREVHVKPVDAEKVYDGTPLTVYDVEISKNSKYGLVEGHRMSSWGTKDCERTEVGETVSGVSENSIEITYYDYEQNIDVGVTGNYKFIYETGIIKIKPRPLTVTTASNSWEYDGQIHFDKGYEIPEDYVRIEGHEFILSAFTQVKNVSKVDNNLKLTVKSGEEDVTKNYKITYIYGKLEITAREVTVKTNSNKFTYNGKAQYDDGYTVISSKGFVEGETVTVTQHTELTNVSKAPNKLVLTVKKDKEDLTSNYKIVYENGELEVVRRKITLKPQNKSKNYDGKPLTCNEIIVAGSSPYPLCDEHTVTAETTGTITDIGSIDNFIVIGSVVITCNEEDVTLNYAISYESGTLEITERTITVKPEDAEKIYDGIPLSSSNIVLIGDDVLEKGNRIEAQIIGSQTEPGTSVSMITGEVKVFDSENNDVTYRYKIKTEKGVLTVNKIPVTITSASAQKEYDGLPLVNGEYEKTGNLLYGDSIIVTVSGIQTEIGTSPNTVNYTFDGRENYEDYYDITVQEGELVVTPKKISGGGGGGAGKLDEGGDIGLGEFDGEGKAGVAGKIFADVSFNAYLKLKSYGDYTGNKWINAEEYTKLIDELYCANYVTGALLSQAGAESRQMQIDMLYDYLLPYYIALSGDGQSSDVRYTGKVGVAYTVDYYLPSDLSLLENFVASEKYKQFELEYRAFVYSKYLQIPESTRAYMLSLGFNANDKDIINKVAEFIQSSAVYNMKYDRNLDKEEDIAVSFLRDYGEGICQHYATAATMLYRALGIPARYTIGYVAPTKEGEWSEILSTQAHAWVEVYVDGIGWVQMEVTGGGFGNGGNGNGGNGGGGNGSEDEAPEKIVVVPHSKKASILQVSVLDTVGLGCDVKNWDYYAEKGYTYKVKLNGRQEGIGYSFVTVSQFEVFDENGNEVTDLEIVTEKGTLTINKAVIKITSASEEKEYDGTTLENPTFTVGGVLGENHQVFLDVTGSIKDTGSVQNTIDKDSFKVLNGDIDVTYMYSPEFIEGILTVIGRKITVVTAGAEKFYDGEALTNGYYEVVGELVEGHEIKVVVTGSQTEVGQSDNTAVITITCNGEDVSSVYSITINFGILTVKERKTIEIKPANKVEEYTGNPIVADDIESVSGLDEILAQGYTYGELVFSGSQTEIGESVSQIVNIRIYNALDEDVTEEFNIIRHNGILRVTKKQIVIQVYAISKVYDGKPISYQEEDWFTLSCPADVNLTFKLRGSRTTAGTITEDEIKMQSTFIVTNGLGEDVTDNYYLKLVGKLLTVKARVVEITTVSATKEYDGTPLFAYEYWISKGSLVEGEELFVVMKSQLTEVGMQRNYIDEIKVKDSAGNDVTEYYKFNMIFGDLIVTEE